MNREQALKLLKDNLDKHNLNDWGARLTTSERAPLGYCDIKNKCIILNALSVDIHPDYEIEDTILHEIAHALTPNDTNHGAFWKAKAKELGATSTECSTFSLTPELLDAIRSGATIEYTIETEIIKRPKVVITRLQEKCPECGAIAKEKFSVSAIDREGNDCRIITLECFHIIKKVMPRATPFETMISNDWKPEIKNCKHEYPTIAEASAKDIPPNQCLKCSEFKLFDFQVIGARFAEHGLAIQKGVGIFDDMGLGKTVEGLAPIKFHPDLYTPTLYVVKSALTFKWLKEILRWMGPDYLGQIIKTGRDTLIPGFKTYIISYDLMRKFDAERLAPLNIKLVVMDECQQIKNADSGRTQALRKFVGLPHIKVLPLSGTPWKNRGSELFPVMNMIDPIKFWSQVHFINNWVEVYYEGNKRKEGGISDVVKFKEYTKDLIIRREYNEVMHKFPAINRHKIRVQLDELTQKEYDNATSAFVAWYNAAVISGEEEKLSGIELLAKIAKMRHITGLAKIPATMAYLEEFYENTDRSFVVFVHHQDVGKILYDECIKEFSKGRQILKVTGTMNDAEKFAVQEAFNSKPTFLIASTLAAGEGQDYQTCCDCIMHERQWNPQNEDQAAPGRFRRIGQKSNSINIGFAEAEDTVDEFMDNIVEPKRIAFHRTHNKGEMQTWSEDNIGKELAAMIMARHRAKNKNNKVDRPSLTAMARM